VIKQRKLPGSQAVIYGVHPVLETLRAGRRSVHEVFLSRSSHDETELAALAAAQEVVVSHLTGDLMTSLAGNPHHQGVAAKVGPFPYVELEDLLADSPRDSLPIVVLDEVQDPVNLGTILRSAECLGVRGVVMAKDRAVTVTPVAEKASAGAAAHVPVARVVNLVRALHQLKDAGYWIYGADPRSSESCYRADLTGKVALVLGSEGKGLRRLVRETCDLAVSIPMTGRIESLNVAQTAAILLSECLRRRLVAEVPGEIH